MPLQARKVVSAYDKKTDLACSLKIRSQPWHQSTLNWVHADYWYGATVITHTTDGTGEMLRFTKSSLSFASD